MAAAAAAGNLVQEFSDETTCPVCLDSFTDPVITDCGHNFCQACITQCWEEPDRKIFCPECREPLEQCNVRPNRKLASIVQISKKFSQCRLQEANSTAGAKGVCERHQEPLKLFCREDEAPICVVCDKSKEHREHCVIPVDEAAVEYKGEADTPGLNQGTLQGATCTVYLDYFTSPVTAVYGHNFCRACLTQWCGQPDTNTCSTKQPQAYRKMANTAEIAKKLSLQEPKGKEGTERVCERHQEPLKLFCRVDENPICVVCERSKEHKGHDVIPVDEAAEEYKEQIQAQLPSLEEERKKLTKLKVSEEQRIEECLKQLEKNMQEIPSHFKEMHKFLEEKERFQLSELANLKKEVKKNEEENMTKLANEISHFTGMIKDVEAKCRLPDSEFLQDIRGTLSRCQQGQVRQQLELSPGREWRLRCCSPNIVVLRKAMEELEGLMTQLLCKVNVTLDPDTGNPKLAVSEDLKSVRYGNSKQDLLDKPERFNLWPCVLGHERFTSGRHYWEVEVEVEEMKEKQWWLLGVAQESLSRKGNIAVTPNNKIWSVGKDSNCHPLWAFAKDGKVALTLKHEPKKIWVSLDYEEGLVEFFDADTEDLIFAFPPASFSGEEVRPFFWVGDGVHLHC